MDTANLSEKIEAVLLDRYSINEADYLHQLIFDDNKTKEDVLAFMAYVFKCEQEDIETDIDLFEQAVENISKKKTAEHIILSAKVAVGDIVFFLINGKVHEARIHQIIYSFDAVSYEVDIAKIGTQTIVYTTDKEILPSERMYASIEDMINERPLPIIKHMFEDMLKQRGYTITEHENKLCLTLYYWNGCCAKPCYIDTAYINIRIRYNALFIETNELYKELGEMPIKDLYNSVAACNSANHMILYRLEDE